MSSVPPVTGAVVDINFTGLRNDRGVIHVCATRDRSHFPDCRKDPLALHASARVSEHRMRMTGFTPGRYAFSVIHDENSNDKLDTMMGMPREGFGFSRNPVIRFGPPKFSAVEIDVPSGIARISIRMQYLL